MGTRVYIGRLSYDCRERDIERFFKGYGKIREILIKNGFGFVEFDDYRDADDAVYELNGKDLLGERVILEIARGPVRKGGPYGFRRRGSWIDKISVAHAKGPDQRNNLWDSRGRSRNWRPPQRRWGGRREKYGPPTRTEYRLIVENLSSKVSWQDLKDYMRQAGEVTYADAHKRRRNEGVVEFASYTDMKSAYSKLNGTDLSGRRIKLVEDRSHRRKRSRSRSRSRSPRSRSHSRSRSRSRDHSRSRSPSKSRSRSKSHSRSKSRSKSLSKSRSPHSRSKSHSKSPSRSRSRDKEMHSPSKSRSKSRERSLSRSPSRSPKSDRSKSEADE